MIADIVESLPKHGAPQLCELGKIKIGGKAAEERKTASGNGTWRAPRKDDHFTITTMNRDARGDLVRDEKLMANLIEKYGDPDGKLRQIPIRLLSDDIDDVVQSAFLWYGRSTIGARSDGRKCTWFYNPENLQPYNPPVEEVWNPERLEMQVKGKKLFKPHTVLNCVIAAEEARWGGVYKFRTTSLISFKQLVASLVQIQTLTNGILVGMPLMLVVRPQSVAPEGVKTTVHVVHVELRGGEIKQIQEQAMEQARYKLEYREKVEAYQAQYRKLLVAPGHESTVEARDVMEEFVPEAVNEVPESTGNYSILDGPAPAESEAKTNPPAQVEPKPDAPAPITTDAERDEPDVSGADAEPPMRAVSPNVETWTDTRTALVEAAIDAELLESDLWTRVNLWVLSHPKKIKGYEDKRTTPAERLVLVSAVREGRLGSDGKIVPAKGPPNA